MTITPEQCAGLILRKFEQDIQRQPAGYPRVPFAHWYNHAPIEAYLRYQYSVPPGATGGQFVLCLANVSVAREERQQGIFSYLLDGMIRMASDHDMRLKVESVQSFIVAHSCEKRGMIAKAQYGGFSVCDYWTK